MSILQGRFKFAGAIGLFDVDWVVLAILIIISIKMDRRTSKANVREEKFVFWIVMSF